MLKSGSALDRRPVIHLQARAKLLNNLDVEIDMMSMYFEAANIIKQVNSKKASVKNLVYTSKIKNKKALYALVCETLKFQEILETILTNIKLLQKEKAFQKNQNLALVLLYEHILGKGVTGLFKDCFTRHKSSIHSLCERIKIQHKVTDLRGIVQETPARKFPKYVRVNTLKISCDEVIKRFKEEGSTLVQCSKDNFREQVSNLSSKSFLLDPHIPDLLVFDSSTYFHKHPLYTSGDIILQDKASCFPAYLLSPPAGSHVIDCCAAPGNKTSHLAAIMQNKGQVFAFDKDKKRLATLQELTNKAGATCVQASCADFLTIQPSDNKYRHVEYILVDPSCSGSGMINRTSQYTDETDSCSKERLSQLAKFQCNILKHALSFPAVKKVLYSTCSIHEEENEQVVEQVLSTCGDKFELMEVEPDWSIRGVAGYEHAQCCLRMSHDSCLTNGFFVACFQRKVTVMENSGKLNGCDSDKGTLPVKPNRTEVNSNMSECKDQHKKSRKKKKRKLENLTEANDLNIVKKSKCKAPPYNSKNKCDFINTFQEHKLLKDSQLDGVLSSKATYSSNKPNLKVEGTSSQLKQKIKKRKKKKKAKAIV